MQHWARCEQHQSLIKAKKTSHHGIRSAVIWAQRRSVGDQLKERCAASCAAVTKNRFAMYDFALRIEKEHQLKRVTRHSGSGDLVGGKSRIAATQKFPGVIPRRPIAEFRRQISGFFTQNRAQSTHLIGNFRIFQLTKTLRRQHAINAHQQRRQDGEGDRNSDDDLGTQTHSPSL